jgi:hypothetical protein
MPSNVLSTHGLEPPSLLILVAKDHCFNNLHNPLHFVFKTVPLPQFPGIWHSLQLPPKSCLILELFSASYLD